MTNAYNTCVAALFYNREARRTTHQATFSPSRSGDRAIVEFTVRLNYIVWWGNFGVPIVALVRVPPVWSDVVR